MATIVGVAGGVSAGIAVDLSISAKGVSVESACVGVASSMTGASASGVPSRAAVEPAKERGNDNATTASTSSNTGRRPCELDVRTAVCGKGHPFPARIE
jgi:hypothetical protein